MAVIALTPWNIGNGRASWSTVGLLGAVGLKLDPDKEKKKKKSMRFTPGESQLLLLFLYFFNAAVIGIVLLKHVSILHTELHEEEMTLQDDWI